MSADQENAAPHGPRGGADFTTGLHEPVYRDAGTRARRAPTAGPERPLVSIPTAAIRLDALPVDMRVYLAIASWDWLTAERGAIEHCGQGCIVSYDEIAQRVGLPVDRVRRSIPRLVAAGLVEISDDPRDRRFRVLRIRALDDPIATAEPIISGKSATEVIEKSVANPDGVGGKSATESVANPDVIGGNLISQPIDFPSENRPEFIRNEKKIRRREKECARNADPREPPLPNLPTEPGPSPGRPSRPVQRPAVPLPEDFEPELTEACREMVAGWPPGMFETELAQFRDYHRHKGSPGRDWQAALRTWMRNAVKYSQPSGGRGRRADPDPYLAAFHTLHPTYASARSPTADPMLARWQRAQGDPGVEGGDAIEGDFVRRRDD